MKRTRTCLSIALIFLSIQVAASELTDTDLAITVDNSFIGVLPVSSMDINKGIVSRNLANINIRAIRDSSQFNLPQLTTSAT